jgi:hypothetical protein
MRLAMVKDRNDSRMNEPKLSVVDKLAQVVEWPYSQPAESAPFHVTAELETKLFHERDVERNRYTAELKASSSSPHAILAALTEMCGQIEELRLPGGANEPIILEIRLRG